MLSAIQQWLKTMPKCKSGFEAGGGPMRCANPNNPNSAASIKHPLFALLQLPVPDQKDEPACVVITHSNYLESGNYMVALDWRNDPWEWQAYYSFISNQAHLPERQLTLISGMAREFAQTRMLRRNFRIYDVPQHDWPCALQTWDELLDDRVPIANVLDRRYR